MTKFGKSHGVAGLLLFFSLFTSGCATKALVDYDAQAVERIDSWSCFALLEPDPSAARESVVLSPIVDRRIRSAIRSNLLSKGFTDNCAQPDFVVAYHTVTQTRTEIHDNSFGFSAHRRHPYYGYGLGHLSRLDVENYEVGTYVVDLIDTASNAMVWRGAYTQRLGWSAPDEAEATKIVTTVLSDFPPVNR